MQRRHFLKVMISGLVLGCFPKRVFAGVKNYDDHVKDYLLKMRSFNKAHKDDIYLDRDEYLLLISSVKRLKRLQETVGHGNFSLLNFDDAIKIASNYSQVGPFTKSELAFLEMIFYQDGAFYGFLDEKPLKNITDRIPRRNIIKAPYTGNYLYRGRSFETYKKIKQDVGEKVILTSGVRSIIKQFMLFLNKVCKNNGNLSLASRSLAPPGYSFHGIGDFDVGQAGLGIANFTSRFTDTEVYRRLRELDYIQLRYREDNLLGVRFEPWHIKVI